MTFPVLVHNWRAVPDTQGDGTGGPGGGPGGSGGTGPDDENIAPGTSPVTPLVQDFVNLWPHDIFYTMDDAIDPSAPVCEAVNALYQGATYNGAPIEFASFISNTGTLQNPFPVNGLTTTDNGIGSPSSWREGVLPNGQAPAVTSCDPGQNDLYLYSQGQAAIQFADSTRVGGDSYTAIVGPAGMELVSSPTISSWISFSTTWDYWYTTELGGTSLKRIFTYAQSYDSNADGIHDHLRIFFLAPSNPIPIAEFYIPYDTIFGDYSSLWVPVYTSTSTTDPYIDGTLWKADTTWEFRIGGSALLTATSTWNLVLVSTNGNVDNHWNNTTYDGSVGGVGSNFVLSGSGMSSTGGFAANFTAALGGVGLAYDGFSFDDFRASLAGQLPAGGTGTPTVDQYLYLPVPNSGRTANWNFTFKPWAITSDGQTIIIAGSTNDAPEYAVSTDGGQNWTRYLQSTVTYNENGFSAQSGSGLYEITNLEVSNSSGRIYANFFNNTTREQRFYYSSDNGASWERFVLGNSEGDVNAPNYFCFTMMLDESGGSDRIVTMGRMDGNPAIPDPPVYGSSVFPFSSHIISDWDAPLSNTNGYYLLGRCAGSFVGYYDGTGTDYLAFWNGGAGSLPTYSTTNLALDLRRTADDGSRIVIATIASAAVGTVKTFVALDGPADASDLAAIERTLPPPPVNCQAVDYGYNPASGWIAVARASNVQESVYVWRSVDGLSWTEPTEITVPDEGASDLSVDKGPYPIPLGPAEWGFLFIVRELGSSVYGQGLGLLGVNAQTGSGGGSGGIRTIEDKGTEQYPNSVVGAPLFEQPPIVADNGTSVQFTADGSVVTTGVVANQHIHTFILNLEGTDTTFFDNGDITLSFEELTIYVNGVDTGLGPETRYLVVMQDGDTITSYANNSLIPITTGTVAQSATVTQTLLGDGVIVDWYILDDLAKVDLPTLMQELDTQFPSFIEYDQSVGLSPTEVTPAPGGNVLSQSQPRNQLAPTAWHIRDDGGGMFFLNGNPNLQYVTTDFGDTWTGPIDKSGSLQPRNGINPGDETVVGQLAYGGGSNYVLCLTYNSSRTGDIAYSTDNGSSWTRINTGFYAWGVDMVGGEILHTLRSSSSGGQGLTNYYTTGGAGYNLHATGTDNGAGGIIAADGSWAMALYQNGANSVFRSSWRTERTGGSIPVWDDINPNPALSWSGQYAKIPGSPLVFNATQRFTGDATPDAMPITQLDHLETAQSNFSSGVAAYQSGTGTLIRSWSFSDSDNNNTSKIHMELNEGTTVGGWGNKFHINLPENHNHANNGMRDRMVGAGPYWFYSFVGDTTDSVRLVRFKFPLIEGLEIPPIAEPTTGRVAYKIGADAPSFIETTDEFGETRFDIGNDIPVSPTFDVVGSIPSNHSTLQPKVGAGHLSIPGHAGTTFYRPLTVPYWNGREEIGLQDFTFDCWVKANTENERAYPFSSQAIGVSAGKVFRWGGMTVYARGSGTNGYIQVYVGKSEADAAAEIDNDLRYGSAMALFGSWQQDAAVWRPNDYNFISICRRNGRWALYLNGRIAVALNSAPVDPGTFGPSDAYIHAGGDTLFGAYLRPYSATEYALYGDACYIDDARLIIGECIHTTPIFTVPDGPLSAV